VENRRKLRLTAPVIGTENGWKEADWSGGWNSSDRSRAPFRARLYGVLRDSPSADGTSTAPHHSAPFRRGYPGPSAGAWSAGVVARPRDPYSTTLRPRARFSGWVLRASASALGPTSPFFRAGPSALSVATTPVTPMAGWLVATILGGTRAPLVPIAGGGGWACRHGRQGAAVAAPPCPSLGPFQVITVPEGGRGARSPSDSSGRKADYAMRDERQCGTRRRYHGVFQVPG
jgi:hypothetical protein